MGKYEKKELIFKSNKLINLNYKLSPNESKIIYMMIGKINQEDEDFKPCKIKIKDFMEMSDLQGNSQYTELPKITKGLLKKGFSMIDEKGNLLQVNWLSSAYHRRKEGILELEFSPKLKPFLLFLKSKFTVFELENVVKLKSFYSMRIYEVLKQYESFGKRIFTIDELKSLFSLHGLKSYDLYSNLKSRVIEIAREELMRSCDIYFDYEEIKEGKKVESIKFIILSKKNIMHKSKDDDLAIDTEKSINDEEDIENKIEESSEVFYITAYFKEKYKTEISEDNIRKLIKEKGRGNVKNKLKEFDNYIKNKNIKNVAGYFYTYILKDFKDLAPQEEKTNRKKQPYENFEQRSYDEVDYEKLYSN